jgi:hypothetical protein
LGCTLLRQQTAFLVFFTTAAKAWCIATNLCHKENVSYFEPYGKEKIVQLRYATNLPIEQYIDRKAWKDAKLDHCPLHPEGGCRFAKHGTYPRKSPEGVKIARWYCPDGCATFSMLPDCLCSRLSGTLIDVEDVIIQMESSPSQEAAADNIRLDINLPSALRWMRRRLFLIRITLMLLIDLVTSLGDCQPTVSSFRSVLGIEFVLPRLRMLASPYLNSLPPPLGFGPRPEVKKLKKSHFQHKTGTDPP